MSDRVTLDSLVRALTGALPAVFGARLGGEASAAPSDAVMTDGWRAVVPVSGPLSGQLVLWIDAQSAVACTRVALSASGDAVAGDADVIDFVTALANAAVDAIRTEAAAADIVLGQAEVNRGRPTAGAGALYVAVPNVASAVLAIGAESPNLKTSARRDGRLGAVLDVDLPLVVRFGRITMPMAEVAELGPGSLVDMGRSPDQPVDVLVGDRLIARGEVVVVRGNYGVRITELAPRADADTN